MVLDGKIERPKVELFLPSPNEAMGISDMRLSLDPQGYGFDYRATGGSRLGPFTSNGRILLPKGGRATIAIAALNVAGSVGAGRSSRPTRAVSPGSSAVSRRRSTARSASVPSAATS